MNRVKHLALAVVLAGSMAQTSPPPSTDGAPARAHYATSTTNPDAQAAFDRGLAMLYAFSMGEARLSFAKAAAADPNFALAYWGEALTETVDINQPQYDEGDKRGATELAAARRRLPAASPDERVLIDAMIPRFTGHEPNHGFRAFSDRLQRYLDTHPDDATILTIGAYIRWNAVDGAVLGDGDKPTADAQKMEAALDRAIVLEPANLGAHHLRIHLEEQLNHPERAVRDADFLLGLHYDLGMSHLPHMAGHIYTRIGDYDKLILGNQIAAANDAAYFAQGDTAGQHYTRQYHDHNMDFVLYGLTTEGRIAEAQRVAASEDAYCKSSFALRAHRVDDAIASASSGIRKGVAEARAGHFAEAEAQLKTIGKPSMPGMTMDDDRTVVQRALVRAEIARKKRDFTAAATNYKVVVDKIADELGDPKTYWSTPPGESYATMLFLDGRAPAAENAFRNELKRYPNDPHLFFGLAEALKAQGKDDGDARAAYLRGWKGDRPLTIDDLG